MMIFLELILAEVAHFNGTYLHSVKCNRLINYMCTTQITYRFECNNFHSKQKDIWSRGIKFISMVCQTCAWCVKPVIYW